MLISETPRLLAKYRSLFFGLLFFGFTFSAAGQTYNPSTCCTVSNKAYGAAQAVTTDGRSWFYDATNFVMRDYNGVAEVLSYLNLPKFRSGHFPIYVHNGGVLQSNGIWLGGITQVYWFKDSTGNANLVRWYTDSTGLPGGPFYAVANNLSEGNAGLIKGNLSLDLVNNTSDATKNAAAVSLTNHTIDGNSNTLLNIPNSALSNNTIGLTMNNTGPNPRVSTTPAALGQSLVVSIPYTDVADSGFLRATDWLKFSNKVDSILISTDSVYDVVNGTKIFRGLIPGFQPGWFNVADSGAKGDGVVLTDVVIVNGSANISSASNPFVSTDVGKGIRIGHALSGGAEQLGTITNYISPSTVTVSFTCTNSVSPDTVWYGTDNGPPIQKVINHAFASGFQTPVVYFSSLLGNRYFIFSPPYTNVAGVNPNSLLYIPLSFYSPSAKMQSVTLKGLAQGNYYIDYATGQLQPNAGIILESMRNDSAACILGSPWGNFVYGFFSYTHPHIEGLNFRIHSKNGNTDVKPLMGAIDFTHAAFLSADHVIIETESSISESVKPDTATFGIKTPQFNNGGQNDLRNVLVKSLHDGIVVNENTNGDNLMTAGCFTGILYPPSNHTSKIGRLLSTWNKYSIKSQGNASFVVDQLDIESWTNTLGAKWFVRNFDLDDSAAGTSGNINYLYLPAGGGVSNAQITRTATQSTSKLLIKPVGAALPMEWNGTQDIAKVADGSNTFLSVRINGAANTQTALMWSKVGTPKWYMGNDQTSNGTDNFFLNNNTRLVDDLFVDGSGNIGIGGANANNSTTSTIYISRSDNYLHLPYNNTLTTADSSDKGVTTSLLKRIIALGQPLVAANDLTGQTAAVGTVTSYAVPGSGSFNTFSVGGYITVTAISASTLQLQVTWTDETNTSRTQPFFVQGATGAITGTGADGYSPINIRVKQGTTITVSTVMTGVSATYDVGGNISKLY